MKCSVLLPVYNPGAALREAIESILAQDEPEFEFLIIDDRSTDDSAASIRSFAEKDARIRPIFHQRNAGLAATLNEGLREARGEFIARMIKTTWLSLTVSRRRSASSARVHRSPWPDRSSITWAAGLNGTA
jgi:hypothetical protein